MAPSFCMPDPTEMEELREFMRESSADRQRINDKLAHSNEQIGWVMRMLRGDNGTGANGLMVRFALMESRMVDTHEDLVKIRILLEKRADEDSKAKWQLVMALAVATLGILGTIIQALLKH